MKISIITLFPESILPILNSSILKRAQDKGAVEFELVNLRQFGEGVHRAVDDRPYGGGAGMILRADILKKGLDFLSSRSQSKPYVVLTSASGQPFKQSIARQLATKTDLVLICGHYEGVDQRFIDSFVDLEISIGDYVLTGGELPALVIADAVVRLLEGVLVKDEATVNESFEQGLLEYPHYTRPESFAGKSVPQVLKSGDHQKIETWRQQQSLEKTRRLRPDLLKK